MHTLVGERINGVYVNHDRTMIVFVTNLFIASFSAEGDCCSTSWIEHLSGVDALIGQLVVSVTSIDLPAVSAADSWKEIKVYGWNIKTERGIATLEMRNESNGYYGGWLEPSTLDFVRADYRAVVDDF